MWHTTSMKTQCKSNPSWVGIPIHLEISINFHSFHWRFYNKWYFQILVYSMKPKTVFYKQNDMKIPTPLKKEQIPWWCYSSEWSDGTAGARNRMSQRLECFPIWRESLVRNMNWNQSILNNPSRNAGSCIDLQRVLRDISMTC